MRSLATPVLLFAIAVPASAQAAITSNFLQSTVMLAREDESALSGMELSLFDSNLGTLTSATVTVDADVAYSVFARAQGAFSTGSILMQTNLLVTAARPSVGTVLFDDTLSTTSGLLSLTPQQGTMILSYADASTATRTFTSAAALVALQSAGGGRFGVLCAWDQPFAIVTGSINWDGPFTAATCKTTIEYTYTPTNAVPEPASIALVCLAGLGLLGSRRSSSRPRARCAG